MGLFETSATGNPCYFRRAFSFSRARNAISQMPQCLRYFAHFSVSSDSLGCHIPLRRIFPISISFCRLYTTRSFEGNPFAIVVVNRRRNLPFTQAVSGQGPWAAMRTVASPQLSRAFTPSKDKQAFFMCLLRIFRKKISRWSRSSRRSFR